MSSADMLTLIHDRLNNGNEPSVTAERWRHRWRARSLCDVPTNWLVSRDMQTGHVTTRVIISAAAVRCTRCTPWRARISCLKDRLSWAIDDIFVTDRARGEMLRAWDRSSLNRIVIIIVAVSRIQWYKLDGAGGLTGTLLCLYFSSGVI